MTLENTKSLYKKSGMNNQKAALLKDAIKSVINRLPHSSKSPVLKFKYLKGFHANLKLNGYPLCLCNESITTTQRTMDKARIFLDEPKKKRGKGRPPKLLEKKYPHAQFMKGMGKMKKEAIATLCDSLNIKEKDLDKFFLENPDLIEELANALMRFSQS